MSKPSIVAALVGGLLLTAYVRAQFAPAQGIPVDRLVRNITAYAQEHPRDAHAQYLLGRVHALAFRHDRTYVGTYGKDAKTGLPRIGADTRQSWTPPPGSKGIFPPPDKKPPPLSSDQKAKHVRASITAYTRAIELDPAPSHYHLGLAFILDRGRPLLHRVPPPDRLVPTRAGKPAEAAIWFQQLSNLGDPNRDRDRDSLQAYWREAAIDRYLEAYKRSIDKDLKITHQPLEGIRTLVSHEAGTTYIKLVQERKPTPQEGKTIVGIQVSLKALAGKRPGPVTPIIFSLDAPRPLSALLAPGRRVRFDLDGDGTAEQRPWVAANTAILVWDPYRTGRITSGRQLFGSVTFHMYPGDGYLAMNLLDDDRDGELANSELHGLAIWTDRDQDGRSDAGEVTPIEQTAIAGIRVHALDRNELGWLQPLGLRLTDGRILPTYDWIAPAP
ncbi:MAG: hypothetical protein OER86_13295 [Phycisphaerae bacterium]|nr:hypothetical protein [Phycisphaerae bacterium]